MEARKSNEVRMVEAEVYVMKSRRSPRATGAEWNWFPRMADW